MGNVRFGSIFVIAAVLMLVHACPVVAAPVQTYLALGDSIAFGETDVIPVSFGDQGYVKPFADFLATENGGVRPNVINLAFPGETSSSFFTAIPPPGDAPHTVLDSFNLNYQANPAQSQNGLTLSTIAAEQAAGHVISHVSFSLGRNDLGAFVAQHPNFFSLTPIEQQGLIDSFFGDLTANYVAVLTELRAALPNAQILLLNSYNEQAVFGSADPFNIVNEIFDVGQTAMIHDLAGPFNARLVDIHDPFIGHEAAYTFVLSGGVHPTDTGYGVIADQMIEASMPEPPSFGIFAGAMVLIVLSRRLAAGGNHGRTYRPLGSPVAGGSAAMTRGVLTDMSSRRYVRVFAHKPW
jgi:lysophospholipase L1-like esterase